MRTRFAPAPTGFLHLGHAANALYVWGLAAVRAADVIVRIEDHDRQRSRPEYEAALLEDLAWLGFGAEQEARAPPSIEYLTRQSERGPIYEAAAADLTARGLVYGCRCTRQELDGPRYPGTCRDLALPLGEGIGWRLRLGPDRESFADLLCGPQEQTPQEQCGDVLIRDRLGNWTYQFVAALDDHLQGIDLIVRGVDLLDSTGRQIAIARLCGRQTPATFAHHPLIMKTATQKLSKSDGDTSIRELRAAGWTPERALGEAAWRVGLIDAPRAVEAREARSLFGGDIAGP